MIRMIVCLILILSCSPYAGLCAERIAPEPFPIHAWVGPPANETTIERYRELADAGFTHSFSGFPDNDAMEKALDIARKCGIKLFIATPDLYKDPEGTARRFMNHPAIAGYSLRDEPNAKDFADLGAWAERIRTVDDAHPCYINLFPNYASEEQLGTPTYREHVARFIEEVPVQMLTFDHYPVTEDGLRPEWYENLEIVSEAARNANKPLWAFSLAVAHDPYPIPNIAHIRLQVYSNLAYGVQGIQYFTYWTPGGTRWNFHEGPIRKDGTRSPVYDLVKEVNKEIKGLSGVFAGAKVISVGHTGETIPDGVDRYFVSPPFFELNTTGSDGAIISLLEKGDRRFLAVVNRDIDNSMKLKTFSDKADNVRIVAKNGFLLDPASFNPEQTVLPGDIVVFTWLAK